MTELLRLLRRAVHGVPPGSPDTAAPEIRVEGTDETGLLQVAVIDREQDRVFRVRVPDVNALVALAGPPLRDLRDLSDSQLPYVPHSSQPLPVKEQALQEGAFGAVLGGATAQDNKEVVTARAGTLTVAGFTSRGPTEAGQGIEYKAYNEDAVVIRLRQATNDKPVVAAVGAFDQAGGEGHVEDRPGAASAIAAEAFDAAVTRVERGDEPQQALREAVAEAGRNVLALGVGAVTTFAGVVVVSKNEGLEAHVAVVGDSRALHFDRTGKLLNATDQHNFGKAVAAGLVDDVLPAMALRFAGVLMRSVGAEPTEPDIYTWTLSPGDRVVVESDGLGDARELEEMPEGMWHADRCATEQGRLVSKAPNAAAAVNTLVGYALDQMADGYGKPDNVAVAILDVASA